MADNQVPTLALDTDVVHVEGPLDTAYNKLRKQINQGKEEPVVPFTLVSLVGEEGIKLLKDRLETAFGTVMNIDIDLIANTIKALPVLAQTDEAVAASDMSQHSDPAQETKIKIARPPNAFILYRKDWHATVVAENPTLHNNRISVIIGKKWRDEAEDIKDLYRHQAKVAKARHAALHPSYTYQPRKPSERKKRMTKSKIAKMMATGAVEAPLITFDDDSQLATFHAGLELNNGIALQFEAQGHELVYEPVTTTPFSLFTALPLAPGPPGPPVGYLAENAYRVSDDTLSGNVISFPIANYDPSYWASLTPTAEEVAMAFFTDSDLSASGVNFAGIGSSVGADAGFTAEASIQEKLQKSINTLFDFDRAAGSGTKGASAGDNMDHSE